MAVLNDLLVKGKTRLIGDVNASNIKVGTLNISGTATANALIGGSVSSTGSISGSSITASTSITEGGVLLSNKYALKTSLVLSNIKSDSIAQVASVANGERILVCGTNTSSSTIREPNDLSFDTNDASTFLRHDGKFVSPIIANCYTVNNIVSGGSLTNAQVTGSIAVGGLIVGGNGGIAEVTSFSGTAGIYSVAYTYRGSVFGSGTFTLQNSTNSATWNYQKSGRLVTIWGPTGAFFQGSSAVFTGLPFAPTATTYINLPFWSDSTTTDGYFTVAIYTESATTKMAIKSMRSKSGNNYIQETIAGTMLYNFAGYCPTPIITYIAST